MKVVKSIINVWSRDKETGFVMDRNERKIGMDERGKNRVRIIRG